MEPPRDGEMDALLAYVHERRNFDFRGYKRASLSRRIAKRMGAIGVDTYQRYMEVLEANPGEFGELFNTILINVTSLLRDADAWEYLAQNVIPAIAQSKGEDEPIRIWSAGCASGEEAYSLALLFAESLGQERFWRAVKLYATDADDDALVAARHGRYREKNLVEAFGEDRANQYFEMDSGFGVFRAELRRSLIFGRHDLVQDAPISRIDLVACRNTLMYFTSEVQLGVLATLHFALNPGGYLFLGKSEGLVSRTDMFQVVDLRHRVFRKDGTQTDVSPMPNIVSARSRGPLRSEGARLSEVAVESGPVPQLVVDSDMTIVVANREARRLLALGSVGAGRPVREAEVALRPLDLRTPIERVLRKRQPLRVPDVSCDTGPDGSVVLDLIISPLENLSAVEIALVDVTRYQHLRDELEQSQRELESAYEELQSAVEELETTNEELQSTNEELETTNEELHSTNEELETMNEELQSTNEELETINNELRERSGEVDQLNEFLQTILGSLESAVIVLDTGMQVQAWNRQAEELWGVRSDEVMGQHFLNLDIGFPVETLRNPIRAGLSGREDLQHLSGHAVNRRGRPIECTVDISTLVAEEGIRGVLILMNATPADQEALEGAVNRSPQGDGQVADKAKA